VAGIWERAVSRRRGGKFGGFGGGAGGKTRLFLLPKGGGVSVCGETPADGPGPPPPCGPPGLAPGADKKSQVPTPPPLVCWGGTIVGVPTSKKKRAGRLGGRGGLVRGRGGPTGGGGGAGPGAAGTKPGGGGLKNQKARVGVCKGGGCAKKKHKN